MEHPVATALLPSVRVNLAVKLIRYKSSNRVQIVHIQSYSNRPRDCPADLAHKIRRKAEHTGGDEARVATAIAEILAGALGGGVRRVGARLLLKKRSRRDGVRLPAVP
ncbi:hypothetical protein FB451DRAFT_1184340 [Mycena latifolia]|nr:hypothetical protein FB451DRAFT_1184340 [Mycena latifolia]